MRDDEGKRRRGRPALPPSERRTERVVVQVRTEEYDRICEIARRNRVSMARVVRTMMRLSSADADDDDE